MVSNVEMRRREESAGGARGDVVAAVTDRGCPACCMDRSPPPEVSPRLASMKTASRGVAPLKHLSTLPPSSTGSALPWPLTLIIISSDVDYCGPKLQKDRRRRRPSTSRLPNRILSFLSCAESNRQRQFISLETQMSTRSAHCRQTSFDNPSKSLADRTVSSAVAWRSGKLAEIVRGDQRFDWWKVHEGDALVEDSC